jgi:hypothetical protein
MVQFEKNASPTTLCKLFEAEFEVVGNVILASTSSGISKSKELEKLDEFDSILMLGRILSGIMSKPN